MKVSVYQARVEDPAMQPSELARVRCETPRLPLDLLQHRRPVDPLQDEAVGVHLEDARHRDTRRLRAPHDRRLTRRIARLALPVAAQDGSLAVLEYVAGAARSDEYP
jgi:hypothetical protein